MMFLCNWQWTEEEDGDCTDLHVVSVWQGHSEEMEISNEKWY